MRMLLKALSAATLVMAPAAANAADYLIYKFGFSGFEQRFSNINAANSGAISGDIIYYLPTYFAGATTAVYDTSSLERTMRITGSASSNMFTLRDIQTLFQRSGSRDITIKACTMPSIPGPTIAIDPSCSSVVFQDIVSLGFTGADVRNLGGTVTSLSITEGFGSATLGLVSYPVLALVPGQFLPEPASWAMMIFGMGTIGFAMRRRPRVRTTVRSAS